MLKLLSTLHVFLTSKETVDKMIEGRYWILSNAALAKECISSGLYKLDANRCQMASSV